MTWVLCCHGCLLGHVVLIVWTGVQCVYSTDNCTCSAILLRQLQVEWHSHVYIDCQHISSRKDVINVKNQGLNYTVMPLANLGQCERGAGSFQCNTWPSAPHNFLGQPLNCAEIETPFKQWLISIFSLHKYLLSINQCVSWRNFCLKTCACYCEHNDAISVYYKNMITKFSITPSQVINGISK